MKCAITARALRQSSDHLGLTASPIPSVRPFVRLEIACPSVGLGSAPPLATNLTRINPASDRRRAAESLPAISSCCPSAPQARPVLAKEPAVGAPLRTARCLHPYRGINQTPLFNRPGDGRSPR